MTKRFMNTMAVIITLVTLFPALANAAQKATKKDYGSHYCIIEPSKAGGDTSFCYIKESKKEFKLKSNFITNIPDSLNPVDQEGRDTVVTYCQPEIDNEPCIILGNGTIQLEKGFTWDGKSGPGNRENPKTMRATLVHDALYELMRARKICDPNAEEEPEKNQTKFARFAADAYAGLLICEDGGNADVTAWGVHLFGKNKVNNGDQENKMCNSNSITVAGQTLGPANSIKCGKEAGKNLAQYKNDGEWLVWESYGYD